MENPKFGFIFYGRHINSLREAIYTQIVTVNILICYLDLYYCKTVVLMNLRPN